MVLRKLKSIMSVYRPTCTTPTVTYWVKRANEKPKESTKASRQYRQFPVTDFNPRPPEYESGTLTTILWEAACFRNICEHPKF
jgi:hypothetical protein